MPTIRLISIKCTVPDEIDKDEMYLKYDGEKIWPHGSLYFRIDVDEVAEVDHTLDVPEGWVEIELWDYDFVSRNDLLGTFKFKVDDTPGEYSTSLKRNEEETHVASYYLEWEILD